MSYSVTVQPDARVELDEIFAYVARNLRNPLDAARLVGRLEEAILGLAETKCRIAHLWREIPGLPYKA